MFRRCTLLVITGYKSARNPRRQYNYPPRSVRLPFDSVRLPSPHGTATLLRPFCYHPGACRRTPLEKVALRRGRCGRRWNAVPAILWSCQIAAARAGVPLPAASESPSPTGGPRPVAAVGAGNRRNNWEIFEVPFWGTSKIFGRRMARLFTKNSVTPPLLLHQWVCPSRPCFVDDNKTACA